MHSLMYTRSTTFDMDLYIDVETTAIFVNDWFVWKVIRVEGDSCWWQCRKCEKTFWESTGAARMLRRYCNYRESYDDTVTIVRFRNEDHPNDLRIRLWLISHKRLAKIWINLPRLIRDFTDMQISRNIFLLLHLRAMKSRCVSEVKRTRKADQGVCSCLDWQYERQVWKFCRITITQNRISSGMRQIWGQKRQNSRAQRQEGEKANKFQITFW